MFRERSPAARKGTPGEDKLSCWCDTIAGLNPLPGLTGDYLPVSCETSWSKLPAKRSEFVFLKYLGVYFQIFREILPTIKSSFKIKHF
jgi:hypothetical protein